MTDDEKRAYARGYSAGRKNANSRRSLDAERRAENRFWQQVFCAALQGTLVNAGWRTGEKPWVSSGDYIRGCGNIADEAIRQHRNRK